MHQDKFSAALPPRHVNPLVQVDAASLDIVLDQYAGKIRVLSLDCFDTIIWRKTATPDDVFYDLEKKPLFQTLGLTARLRRQAESHARDLSRLRSGESEVTLEDIYQAHHPQITKAQSEGLSSQELETELDVCYAFPPVIELIRKAARQGLKIIIVSDTYLNKQQLTHLLREKLPQDVMRMISSIYCSCEYGKSKKAGLFHLVLDNLKISPKSVLHIGDNPIADFHAPRELHINALTFIHHYPALAELIRMHALAGSYIDPEIRNSRPLTHPFRGLFASQAKRQEAAETTLGYATLGPLMYAFARFILRETSLVNQSGKPPKVLFLMRDAYLPSLACQALAGYELGSRVRISRFAAYASSFRSRNDIDTYLSERVQSKRFDEMSKQLLLSEESADFILKQTEKSRNPVDEFIKFIHQPKTQQEIFDASAAYRKRLFKHLQNETSLEQGDSVVFIDLGYSGTAQRRLAPVFKDEFNVKITGRYLISLPCHDPDSTRSGLLDTSNLDENALIMLVSYIALLEQMCTSNEKSVIDYDEHGNAVYAETAFGAEQYEKLQKVQSECLRFIHDIKEYQQQIRSDFSDEILRDAAAINLCRLLFLPLKTELEFLQTFHFDFNLGCDEVIRVFDVHKGLEGLRRRSWLHCSKETSKNMRTNYPAEWRSASLELALTLMSQHRFGLEFALNDLSHRRESLEILVFQGQQVTPLSLESMPTHDGYFSLMIPVVSPDCPIAIRFGAVYKWVEIESAELIELTTLYSSREVEHTHNASTCMSLNEMKHHDSGLFECLTGNAVLIFDPAGKIGSVRQILRIIFRPIVRREKQNQ